MNAIKKLALRHDRKYKIILSAACISLLAIGGALAALTAHESAINELSIISSLEGPILSEPNWDPDDATELSGGETVAKDPTVTNNSDVDCYAYIKVSIPLGTVGGTDDQELFSYTVNTGWTQVGTDDASEEGFVTRMYTCGKLSPEQARTLFDSVTVAAITAGDYTDVTDVQIPVTAYLVQARDFDNADAAATALN